MLTNVDLEEQACRLHIPLVGVFSKDQLPRHRREGGYIVNLQDAADEHGNPLPGTHWTAFYIEKGQAVYFDPFGVWPPRAVQTFLQPFRPWHFSTKQVQNIRSTICGYYVLYFVWFMARNRSLKTVRQRFQAFLRLFSTDVEKNKTLLEKYLKPL